MNGLKITRGYAGSGKSTLALAWVAEDPENRARVNRDELRMALYGKYHGLTWKQEEALSAVQKTAVRVLLRAGKGVVVDDTNLRLKYARDWADLAAELGLPFEVWDVKTPVDECVERDRLRGQNGGRCVGEAAIRGMAERYSDPWQGVHPTAKRRKRRGDHVPAPYSQREGLGWCWIFDIDGTLAHNDGHRGWYGDEELKVGADKTWPEVVNVAVALSTAFPDDPILFMSGRTERCRKETSGWIRDELGLHADEENLFMRAEGDQRPDDIVKDELFEAHVAGRWNVHAVFDDRPSVARMWRTKGLRTFQVGDPHQDF